MGLGLGVGGVGGVWGVGGVGGVGGIGGVGGVGGVGEFRGLRVWGGLGFRQCGLVNVQPGV